MVTGGLGGLGLQGAALLAKMGATRLVLASRIGPNPYPNPTLASTLTPTPTLTPALTLTPILTLARSEVDALDDLVAHAY